MSRENRVPSKVMVNVVDKSGLEKGATEELQKTNPDAKAEIRVVIGYVNTSKGVFVLCEEGVGSSKPITADNPFEIDVYTSAKDLGDGNKTFALFPTFSFKVNDKHILELPILKKVPLHEFIRTFGRRLDDNYASWESHFSKTGTID